jgi:hypothetical protein
MKPRIILALAATLIATTPALAENCLKLDEDNEPVATISGRVTTQHKVPKGSELRSSDGPWLILDQPLVVDFYDGCRKWSKIAVMANDPSQSKKWTNQRVVITGKLGRFGSALVSPSVYITITTIKKRSHSEYDE